MSHDSVQACLNVATKILKKSNIQSCRLDATLLMSKCLNLSYEELILQYDEPVESKVKEEFFKLIVLRSTRKPLAYIIGEKEFFSYKFKVNESTLIPRSESELIVETILDYADKRKPSKILDLCTGSGAIGITVANQSSLWQVVGSDISASALKVAARNIQAIGKFENISLLQSDLFDQIDSNERFDFIITNPPYIGLSESDTLEKELSFEPPEALFAGEDGFAISYKIIEQASDYLALGGILIIEIGSKQLPELSEFMQRYSRLKLLDSKKDLANLNRILIGEL
ncbi:MAG: peptide chain release factor N(5)-glutamine methyltransferase [Nitrospinota bacterium]